MTDHDRQTQPIEDDVLDQAQQEAQLHYRAVARRKDERKDARGPVPLPGGSTAGGAPAGAVAPGPAAMPAPSPSMGAPAAAASAAFGAAAAPTPSEDPVRFGDEQLTASRPTAPGEDPWGAYDNPDNVPGLALDDEDARETASPAGMALRGSGTRGRKDAGGGMAPFVPMGGGTGAPATTLPGATVGGVGASSGLAAQQPALTVQAALSAAQQGNLPLNLVQGLGAARASGALMSPPATGVLAAGAGSGAGIDGATLDETIRRLGIDSDQPFVVGPDGNLYPNPYYVQAGTAGPLRSSAPAAADLDGDGVVSDWERTRWEAAHDRTGGSSTTGGGSYPGGGGGGYTTTGGGSVSSPSAQGGSSDGGGWSSVGGGVSGTGWSGGGGSHSGSGTGGLSGQTAGGPSYGSPGTGGYSAGGYSSGGSASGQDYSVRTDELRDESQEWEEIAERQGQLAKDVESLPDPAPTFGVLSAMVPPYAAVQDASAESAQEAGTESQYTAGGLDQNAASYDANEHAGSAIAGRIND